MFEVEGVVEPEDGTAAGVPPRRVGQLGPPSIQSTRSIQSTQAKTPCHRRSGSLPRNLAGIPRGSSRFTGPVWEIAAIDTYGTRALLRFGKTKQVLLTADDQLATDQGRRRIDTLTDVIAR